MTILNAILIGLIGGVALPCAIFAVMWIRAERRCIELLKFKADAEYFEACYNELLTEKLQRARAIENATLQRQGIAIPASLKTEEEPKPERKHRPIGGADRLRKYLDHGPAPVEPVRTVGPESKKIN